MNTLEFVLRAVLAAPLLAAPLSCLANEAVPATLLAQAADNELSDGEVRKIDKAAGKITIKHGEIKNLDMPPMTMVFQAKDMAALETLKAGDKVRFKAEKTGGAFVVTRIEPAR